MSLSFIRYIDLNDTHFIANAVCVIVCVCTFESWSQRLAWSTDAYFHLKYLECAENLRQSYCTCLSCCSDQSHAWHFDVFVEEDTGEGGQCLTGKSNHEMCPDQIVAGKMGKMTYTAVNDMISHASVTCDPSSQALCSVFSTCTKWHSMYTAFLSYPSLWAVAWS